MAQKKGQTGNPKGRPKGTPNRSTAEIRSLYSQLLSNNIESLQESLDLMQPKERFAALLKLSEFVLPKAKESEEKDDQNKFRNEFMKSLGLGD